MRPMSTTWTINTIIAACGGTSVVASALGLTTGAVSKMRHNGIQDRHWRTLMDLCPGNLTPDDLYRANERTRAGGAGADGAAA